MSGLVVSHRQVWALALPIIVSNLTIPLLGAVDTAVMGHLPAPQYLAAVGLGSVIFSFLFWSFGFLRMGTTGLVAQAYGRDDIQAVIGLLLRSLFLALLCATLVLTTQFGIEAAAFALIDTEPVVEALAREYFSLRIWAAPASLVNYVLLGWYLGMQNTRASLIHMLVINLLNIVLDIVFVQGFGLTVAGVALASVIAEYVGVLIGVWLVTRMLRRQGIGWHSVFTQVRLTETFGLARLKPLLKVNLDIMVRTLCLIGAFGFFARQGATFGPVVLAANTVLLNFQNIMAYGLDGLAHAAEALVGKTVGAGDRAALHRAMRITGVWSALVALVFAAAYWAFGNQLINWLTDLPDVRLVATTYLPWLIISPLISVWSFWLDGVFIGATWTRAMRQAMMVSLFLVLLPVWWLTRDWANHGLWFALISFMAARGVTMYWYLMRQKAFLPRPG